MSTTYVFHCKDCDLEATVSGGDDRSFYVATRTVFCTQCKALTDVLIGNTKDPTHPVPEDCRLKLEDLGKCPHCRSTEVTPWKRGDRCPRCGGSVEKDDSEPGVLGD